MEESPESEPHNPRVTFEKMKAQAEAERIQFEKWLRERANDKGRKRGKF